MRKLLKLLAVLVICTIGLCSTIAYFETFSTWTGWFWFIPSAIIVGLPVVEFWKDVIYKVWPE